MDVFPRLLSSMIQQRTTSAISQPNCRLLQLPAELRLRIYEFVSREPTTIQLRIVQDIYCRRHDRHISGLTLLVTCKQIRNEAYEIVWSNLNFHITWRITKYDPVPPGAFHSTGLMQDTGVFKHMRNARIRLEISEPTNCMFKQLRIAKALQKQLIANENLESLTFELNPEVARPWPHSRERDWVEWFAKHVVRALKTREMPVNVRVMERRNSGIVELSGG